VPPFPLTAGGMAEWLKAHAWKACMRATVSWVRIPLPPPKNSAKPLLNINIVWATILLIPQSYPHRAGGASSLCGRKLVGKFFAFFDHMRRCECSPPFRDREHHMTEPTINDHIAVADRLAVSPAEAARLAGVGRTTIYEAIGSGALRSLKIGKRRLILIVSLRAWLETAQQALEAAVQAPLHAIPDADAGEARARTRAGCTRKACAVSNHVDRIRSGDGG
jgi:excisionase family DNA binding protein